MGTTFQDTARKNLRYRLNQALKEYMAEMIEAVTATEASTPTRRSRSYPAGLLSTDAKPESAHFTIGGHKAEKDGKPVRSPRGHLELIGGLNLRVDSIALPNVHLVVNPK